MKKSRFTDEQIIGGFNRHDGSWRRPFSRSLRNAMAPTERLGQGHGELPDFKRKESCQEQLARFSVGKMTAGGMHRPRVPDRLIGARSNGAPPGKLGATPPSPNPSAATPRRSATSESDLRE